MIDHIRTTGAESTSSTKPDSHRTDEKVDLLGLRVKKEGGDTSVSVSCAVISNPRRRAEETHGNLEDLGETPSRLSHTAKRPGLVQHEPELVPLLQLELPKRRARESATFQSRGP